MNKNRTEPAGNAGQNEASTDQDSLENWLYLRHTAGVGNATFHTFYNHRHGMVKIKKTCKQWEKEFD